MKKFVSLGTECVEFLKAARASQGKLFYYVMPSACLAGFLLILFLTYLFPFAMLQMLWRWPMLA
jgi:hypothetical protein